MKIMRLFSVAGRGTEIEFIRFDDRLSVQFNLFFQPGNEGIQIIKPLFVPALFVRSESQNIRPVHWAVLLKK